MITREATTREEFGSYVLLKKLAEDPLGETFRAGKLGRDGMDQVVLLRVFNGRGLDADRLWQKMADRRPVQESLKSPNIGSGADLGRVRNVPYIAYDYIAGKSLVSLIEQAERARSPIPTDHALLIAERIALGLAVGYETRVADERVLHGFLVPQLIMLSNEGEIRLLGFEAAPGLRAAALAGAGAATFAPYLCPEALAGVAPSKADDVYSLGALLFELLTGKRPPTSSLAEAVDGAVLANEGSHLPGEVAGLIKKSLAPRAERIPEAVSWHKALSKLMIDGHYNPTTFNLAFFMHNLFRDEIERESKEIEAERTMAVPTREMAAAPAAAGAERHREEAAPAREPTATGVVLERYGVAAPKEGGSKTGLFVGLAALLLVGLGAGLYFTVLKPSNPATEEGAAPTETAPGSEVPAADATVVAEPLPADPAAPPEPTAEEQALRAQLDSLLEEKTAAMEKNLRAQYDQKILELQKALDSAQRTGATERARQQPAGERAASAAAERPPVTAPAAAGDGVQPAADRVASLPAGASQPPPQPAAAPSAGAVPPTQAASDPPPADAAAVPAAPSEDGAQPKEEASAAPAPTRSQRVRVGDLIEPGPGVTPPNLRFMPDPRYPRFAAQLNKRATVPVRVLVDENGRVERAELEPQADPGYGFGEAALAAARGARFDPATLSGVRVKMWKVLRIEFKP